jgi:scyllo-inositol 2-dehydrogenase (NADP+)
MSGLVFHAPLIYAHPGFRLTKVCERRTRKATERYPEVEVVRSFDEVLSDPNVELVVVNTPNALHFAQAEQALNAGKHVVVEKPFTVTAGEAAQLIELAKRQKKIITIFQNRRWDGDFMTVQKVVASRTLGKIVEFEAHYDRFRNYIEANTWKEDTGPGSGILYNLGSHMIDQALVLFGPPRRITADVRPQRPGSQIDDSYDIRMDYGDMRVILKSSYLVREPGPRYTLHGVDGSFVKYGLDPQEDALKAGRIPTEAGWGTEPREYWGKINSQINGLHIEGTVETVPGAYLQFYENVYQAITAGAELAVKPEESLLGIQIIEAVLESSRTGKTVDL